MTIDELRDALSRSDIEEQRTILNQFINDTTEDSVIEGIRIASESFYSFQQEFVISSHVKE